MKARRLARGVEAIVLAQASTAALAEQMADLPAAILTSPQLAMKRLAGFVRRAARSNSPKSEGRHAR